MHEIVTLQFGQRANYLATHFWNIQESYFTYAPNTEPSIVDHDIHFRAGLGTDGSDTYTPRTVIYDLKGGFGTLRQRNVLYDDPTSAQQAWDDSGLSTIKQQPITQIPYQQDLDAGLPTSQLQSNQIRYWSDFNRVYYHPRSIVQLSEYSLHSQLTPFESWSTGEELWRDVDREADLLDRDVRPFVEESDSMQGFQVFASVDDAWGGWTERYIDALRDEFGKKSIWVWGLEDTRKMAKEKAIVKKANAAMSLSGIGKLVNGYTRLSSVPGIIPEYVHLQESYWEHTALIAAAMESVTLPVRLRQGNTRGSTMPQFEQVLNTNEGQTLWNLGLSLETSDEDRQAGTAIPDAAQLGTAEDEKLEDDSTIFDISFAPTMNDLLPHTLVRAQQRDRRHVFGQVEIVRRPRKRMMGRKFAPALDRDEFMRRRYNEQVIVERFTVPLGFPQLDSFPATMFRRRDAVIAKEELSFLAGLDTSSTSRQDVMDLRDLVTRHTRAIAVDSREDMYNELTEIAEKYSKGWDSGSDSEDD